MERIPHYFFAVSLTEETKALLQNLSVKMREKLHFLRWEHPEDYHLTLAFLGASEEPKLSLAKKFVEEAVKDIEPFRITLNGMNVFGRPEAPRVLWADLQSDESLALLRSKVFKSCEEAGFNLESRPFKPHITLARKWSGEEQLTQQDLKNYEFQHTVAVNEIVLYKTNINTIPKYEIVETFVFQ